MATRGFASGGPWHDAAMRSPARSARRAAALRAGAAIALVLAPPPARAHVAPAVGDNNRYLKLTPLGDRLRLAYTVFYGDVPGAGLRQAIDADHDGAIDDTESQAFAHQLARDIAAALAITIDGAAQPVAWSEVVVGLGTPRVAAGAFSVDLVAWLCLPAPRGTHAVQLRDRFALDRPGETEVKVEDSPGVAIDASHIDGAVDEAHDYNLVGPSGALETEGLELRFTAGERAQVVSDAICRAPAQPRAVPTGLIAGGAAALVAAVAALGIRRRRQRRAG
jgi:hypothetical protein